MHLSLKITSYQRLTPGQDDVFRPATESFTIGRNSENDWTIPDPQRFLSGSHCRIHCESGNHYITDTSTNGVFLNGSETRLQRNETVGLNHGDKFRIGDYEFEVTMEDPALAGNPQTSEDETSLIAEPFTETDPFAEPDPFAGPDQFSEPDDASEPDSFSDPIPVATPASAEDDFHKDMNTPLAHMDDSPLGQPVNIESLLDLSDDDDGQQDPESAESLEQRQSPLHEAFAPARHAPSPAATGAPPAHEIGAPGEIPDDWDEATSMRRIPVQDVGAAPSGPLEIPDDWDATTGMLKVPAGVPEAPVPQAAPPKPQAPVPAPVATPATPPSSNDAIAAFARGAGLEPGKIAGIDQQVLFEQVGRMLTMFTKGLIQALGGRSEIKNEFRIEQTMIRPAENNPFKFSTSESLTMLQLLSKNDPAYMSGANAIKEGFDDINAHQMAVIAGMEAAVQDILKRFDPKILETRIVSGSVLDSILPGGKKARYWDVFKLLFDEIAGEAEDDFQQHFGREFSRAYEDQLSRLKNTR